jgi:sarcosine dehydrogenase
VCVGIASSGGAGKALAEWIVNGEPTTDLWSVDIRRFSGRVHNNSSFLSARVAETLGLHYQITWPKRELQSGRLLRRSSVHHLHEANGAIFGSKFGWERVNFFNRHEMSGEMRDSRSCFDMTPYSYGPQWWFGLVGEEHRACRASAALFDISSFSKLLLQGADALSALQYLCVNNMDVPIGKLVYTSMCNNRGGIESDVTVCRLATDKFLIVTATSQAVRDTDWITSHLSNGEGRPLFAVITDVTSAEAVLSVMGPRSRELLQCVSTSDLSDNSLPFSFSKIIDIGLANVRAHRITYVGELGYELYIPTESCVLVYETLVNASKSYEIPLTLGGYFAIDSLRLEKGYRAWGHDIGPNDTPIEAGLSFTIAWNKPCTFMGKEALMKQKSQGVSRRLVSVVIHGPSDSSCSSPSPYPYGGEPLYRDNILVGYLTSASFGYTLDRPVGLAYVSPKAPLGSPPPLVDAKYINDGTYEVELSTGRYRAQVSLKPPYDPLGKALGK